MNAKYVFLDVDGTLVNFRGELPASAEQAIKEAQKNGHKMILATGRQKSQIYPWLLEKIPFDGIVASSGAYIEQKGNVIFASRPTPEKLAFIINYFRRTRTPYCLQTSHALIAEQWCADQTAQFLRDIGNSAELVKSLFANTIITDKPEERDDIEKLAYYNSPFDMDTVKEALGDYFYVAGYSLGGGDNTTHHGEITFEGVNKAVGIQKYMDYVNVPVSESIAVGDSGNDLEMLEFAGISVAMGNASSEAKAVAKLITTGIDKDGIRNAFKKLGLIG